MAEGMADLCVFLPLYQGVTSYPKAYGIGTRHSQTSSAYWLFRKVSALGMMNYNEYAPIIKWRYAALEADIERSRVKMEAEFLDAYKRSAVEAVGLLQKWSDIVLRKALRVASDLVEELFTRLTIDIEKEYKFHGA